MRSRENEGAWSFRVSLTNIEVAALVSTRCGEAAVRSAQEEESSRGGAAVDHRVASHFWNQFLDVPLKLPPSPTSRVGSTRRKWQSVVLFCFDGLEKEVPLEVQRAPKQPPPTSPATSISSTSQPSFQSSLSKRDAPLRTADVDGEDLTAVAKVKTFFSYAISAGSGTELAKTLASRYAAVHVLLRRVADDCCVDDAGTDDFVRTRSASNARTIGMPSAEDPQRHDDTKDPEGAVGEKAQDVMVLASATVSLLDLAISEDDRFYFNIFTNGVEGNLGDASLVNSVMPRPIRTASRRRTQLSGQISLNLRMDEEREVSVRPRLVCIRGSLPSASYQLRYRWCPNDALTLGTRQKRAQASSSRESSPSRAPAQATPKKLLPGVTEPRVSFHENQLPTLQLTCSRAALEKQAMLFEVVRAASHEEALSTVVGKGERKLVNSVVVASGRFDLARLLAAAHHDSEIEAAVLVRCESNAQDRRAEDGNCVSCAVEGVLQLRQIPSVRYTLKDFAATAAATPEGKKRDGAHDIAVHGAASQHVRPLLNLVPATALDSYHDTHEHRSGVNGGEDGEDIPRTARPTDVATASASSRNAPLTVSSPCADEPLMTPPQSLRNFCDTLLPPQQSSTSFSLAVSPPPSTALALHSRTSAEEETRRQANAVDAVSPKPREEPHAPASLHTSSAGGPADHRSRSQSGSVQDHRQGTNVNDTTPIAPSDSPEVRTPVEVPLLVAPQKPCSHPLSAEELEPATALRISGTSYSSVVTPIFAADDFSGGEPSVSLPPLSTPHPPSALPLDHASPLELLFRQRPTGVPSASQEGRELNQQQQQQQQQHSASAGRAAVENVSGGGHLKEAKIEVGTQDAPESTLNCSALNNPDPRSSTAFGPDSGSGGCAGLQSESPPSRNLNTARGRPNGTSQEIIATLKDDTAAVDEVSDPIVRPSLAEGLAAQEANLALHASLTKQATLSSQRSGGDDAADATAIAPQLSGDSSHLHHLLEPRAAQPVRAAALAPPSALYRGLDPELVLHFCAPDNDDDEHVDNNEAGLHVAEVAQIQRSLATPMSFSVASSAARSSSAKGKPGTPRSVTSVQLSPAPPPTLAPPRPDPPPAHLLPSGTQPGSSAVATEQHYAAALQLSAQYRTLLAVYVQKLGHVRVAEAHADVAASNVRATRAKTKLPSDGRPARIDGATKATAEWLDHAGREKEEALHLVKNARKRTLALQQRLSDQQAARRLFQAQLRSRDDALASTEEELQRLLRQMVREREETVLPAPPHHPSSGRRGSSARPDAEVAAVDVAAFDTQQRRAGLDRRKLYEAAGEVVGISPLLPTQSSDAGSVRVPASSDRTAPTEKDSGQTSLLVGGPHAEQYSWATMRSPDARQPTLGHGSVPHAFSAAELFSESRLANVARHESSAQREVRAEQLEESSLRLERHSAPALPHAPPPPPPDASPRSTYRRSAPDAFAATSPSPLPARLSSFCAPSRTSRSHTNELSPPPLSRLEQEALLDGIDKGDRPLVMHMLHTKPKLFYFSNNLLHIACAARLPDAAVVEAVLQVRTELAQGIDANTGNSVLHVACAARYPNEDILKKLIIHGAPMQHRNHLGLSPFHVAVLNEADLPRHRIKDTLLTLGDSSVDERTTDGRTALHLVCESDTNLAVVEYLLCRGADTEACARMPVSASGVEQSVTPLELSRVRCAELVEQCIQQAASRSLSRYHESVE